MDSRPERCALCQISCKLKDREVHGEYTLWECAECGAQFWWPFKNPGAEWYEQDRRYNDRNRDPLLTPVDSHELLIQDAPCPGGDVLDIGCGTGNFLAAAQAAGYRVHGTDFDRDAIRVAQEVFRLERVRVAGMEELLQEEQRYDVVTFFEVLEHLDDPVGFMQHARNLLRPKGYVGLAVPDQMSWGVFMVHDKPPRHLTRWTKESLHRFLSDQGFVVIHVVRKRLPFSYLITKFHFWTQRWFSIGLVGKMQAKKAGASTKELANDKAIRRAKKLARIKDYVLFTIPALFLWIYLFFRGRTSGGLYALAQRTDT